MTILAGSAPDHRSPGYLLHRDWNHARPDEPRRIPYVTRRTYQLD